MRNGASSGRQGRTGPVLRIGRDAVTCQGLGGKGKPATSRAAGSGRSAVLTGGRSDPRNRAHCNLVAATDGGGPMCKQSGLCATFPVSCTSVRKPGERSSRRRAAGTFDPRPGSPSSPRPSAGPGSATPTRRRCPPSRTSHARQACLRCPRMRGRLPRYLVTEIRRVGSRRWTVSVAIGDGPLRPATENSRRSLPRGRAARSPRARG